MYERKGCEVVVGRFISLKNWTVKKKKNWKKISYMFKSIREYSKAKHEILFKFGDLLGSKRHSK